MKYTFYRPDNVDTNEFDSIISKLREDLSELVSCQVPQSEIFEYSQKLIADGKPLERDHDMIFWGLDEPGNMPVDAKVDYLYTPTYLAVSILANIKLNYPEIAMMLEDYELILAKGLNAATGRDFLGNGHDRLRGLIDCMDIFASADIFRFIKKYPELCPGFTKKLAVAIEYLANELVTGKVKGDWGEDYSQAASVVIKKIREKN